MAEGEQEFLFAVKKTRIKLFAVLVLSKKVIQKNLS